MKYVLCLQAASQLNSPLKSAISVALVCDQYKAHQCNNHAVYQHVIYIYATPILAKKCSLTQILTYLLRKFKRNKPFLCCEKVRFRI